MAALTRLSSDGASAWPHSHHRGVSGSPRYAADSAICSGVHTCAVIGTTAHSAHQFRMAAGARYAADEDVRAAAPCTIAGCRARWPMRVLALKPPESSSVATVLR